MAKSNSGTRSVDKTHNVVKNQSPILYDDNGDDFYDRDPDIALDYINEVFERADNYGDADAVLEAIRAFTDNGQHDIRTERTDKDSDMNFELENYINIAPKVQGTIYRGTSLSIAEISRLKVGGFYPETGLRSYTTDRSTAMTFGDTDGKVKVLLRDNSNSGVSIRFAAKYPQENEVLVSGVKKRKILGIRKNQGYYIIDVD